MIASKSSTRRFFLVLASRVHSCYRHRASPSATGTIARTSSFMIGPVERNATATRSSTSEATTTSSSIIQRHGTGDAVVVLNVGGKEFHTLRSTIQASPVLQNLVDCAQANGELTTPKGAGKAIFVDRDPTHFGIILQYLRLRAESLSSTSANNNDAVDCATSATTALARKTGITLKKSSSGIPLPDDNKTMSAVYMEASYYGIDELQGALCEQSVWARVMNFVSGTTTDGGGSNPFHAAQKALARLRASLLAMGGVLGTMTMTSASSDDAADSLGSQVMDLIGIRKEEEESAAGEEPCSS